MRKLVLAALFSSAQLVSAGTYQGGKVVKLEFGPLYGDVVHVDVEGQQSGKPACATNDKYDFSFDSSTKIGEKIFSVLLAAQKAGTSVAMSGYGSCSVSSYGNTEDVRWIQSL